jgi:flagella basal body P-ring formation protein FlgA
MTKSLAFLAGAGLLLLVGVGHAAPADPPILKSSARVAAAQIRLGDLFDNAGADETAVIANAPAPGTSIVFDVSWLLAVSHAHHLTWRPPSDMVTIRVDRATTQLDNRVIEPEILKSAGDYGRDRRVMFDTQVRLAIPEGDGSGILVDNFQLVRDSGRFVADVRAPADDPNALPVRVSGRLESVQTVPVLMRPVSPGETIRSEDIGWKQVRAETVQYGDIIAAEQLIGRTPRRPLHPDAQLRQVDVEFPLVVKRNDMVLITLEQPGLYLTASGKALEEGSVGSLIRVTNLQSNRTIDAEVTGSGRVMVKLQSLQQAKM